MAQEYPLVDEVHLDETVCSLKEYDWVDPDKGLRRVQEIRVFRDEGIVRWLYDLGPASAFLALPLVIASGIEMPSGVGLRYFGVRTVGECMEQAEERRGAQLTDDTQEYFEDTERNFREEIYKAYMETLARKNNQSVFGPYETTVRG